MGKTSDGSPWVVLGISADSSAEQVRAAFHSLVKYVHPDRGGDDTSFRTLWAAYQDALRLAPPAEVRPRSSRGRLDRRKKLLPYTTRIDTPGARLPALPDLRSTAGLGEQPGRGRPVEGAVPSRSFDDLLGQEMAKIGLEPRPLTNFP